MKRKDRIDAFGAAALIGFAGLLAVNQIMIKLVSDGLQPVFGAGLRSAIAVICLLIWFGVRRRPLRMAPEARGAALLMGLVFAVEFLLLFVALDLTTVVRTAIIFYSMPVWLALMAHFGLQDEGITRLKAIGLICAFAGTALAIADTGSKAGQASVAGDLCALGAAICWAGTAFLARSTAMVRERPDMQLFCMVAISAPILLLLAPAFGPLIRDLQPLHLWLLLFQGVVVVAAGFVFWLWLLTIYPSASVASFSFLTPILGLGFGWLILGEPVGPGIVAAGTLVALGIILINRPKPDAAMQR